MLRRWTVAGLSVALLAAFMGIVSASPALASQPVTLTNVDIRSGPGQSNGLLGTLPNNTPVNIYCFVAGQPISGPYGTEDLWDALSGGGYLPDALIYTGSNSAVVPACPSSQFGVGNYPVAWTGGGNAQAYAGASNGSGPVGSGIPDGQLVSVTCETSGQTLTDSAGFTSNLWDRLASGGYVSNVYLDTQVNGPTPGLSACASAPPPPPPPPSTGPIASASSSNWSGYVGVAKKVSEVRATWKVPRVTCNGSSKNSSVSIWTGIDDTAVHLVQAGTTATCSSSNATPVYYTWWESLPARESAVAYLSAGAQVTVDISYRVGPTTYFAVTLAVNGSTKFTRTVPVKNEPLSQAECIVEAPTHTRTILGISTSNPTQLAKFAPVTFTDCRLTTASTTGQQIGRGSVNGISVTRITMTDLRRSKDAVGTPGAGGTPWTVTWKNPDLR